MRQKSVSEKENTVIFGFLCTIYEVISDFVTSDLLLLAESCGSTDPHCNENTIFVFLFWELRVLSPNFHIHVSVSDLYIPRIGPHIFQQQNRQIDQGNI